MLLSCGVLINIGNKVVLFSTARLNFSSAVKKLCNIKVHYKILKNGGAVVELWRSETIGTIGCSVQKHLAPKTSRSFTGVSGELFSDMYNNFKHNL